MAALGDHRCRGRRPPAKRVNRLDLLCSATPCASPQAGEAVSCQLDTVCSWPPRAGLAAMWQLVLLLLLMMQGGAARQASPPGARGCQVLAGQPPRPVSSLTCRGCPPDRDSCSPALATAVSQAPLAGAVHGEPSAPPRRPLCSCRRQQPQLAAACWPLICCKTGPSPRRKATAATRRGEAA